MLLLSVKWPICIHVKHFTETQKFSHHVGLFSINSSSEELDVQVSNDTTSNQQLGTLEYSHSEDLIGQCHRVGRSSHLTPQLWCGRRACLVCCHDDDDKLGCNCRFWVTRFFFFKWRAPVFSNMLFLSSFVWVLFLFLIRKHVQNHVILSN